MADSGMSQAQPAADDPARRRRATVLHDERVSLLRAVHGSLEGVMILLSAAWIGLVVVELIGDGLSRTLAAAIWMIWAIFVSTSSSNSSIAPSKRPYLRTTG